MTLFYYDKETMDEKIEDVPLADEEWPIATMTTPEEFQLHYFSKRVKNNAEICELLQRLTDMNIDPLLPKKFQSGVVYSLTKQKVKHLQQLSGFLSPNGKA